MCSQPLSPTAMSERLFSSNLRRSQMGRDFGRGVMVYGRRHVV